MQLSEKGNRIFLTCQMVIYRTKFLAICGFLIGWLVQNVASIPLFEGKDFCGLTFLDALKQHFRGNSFLYEPCIINVLEPKYGYKIRAFWFRAEETSPSPQLVACLQLLLTLLRYKLKLLHCWFSAGKSFTFENCIYWLVIELLLTLLRCKLKLLHCWFSAAKSFTFENY